MLKSEVLVSKLGAVDGLATSAVAGREVSTLGHETVDDAVEGAALEVEGLALGTLSLLTCAEGSKVL